MFHCDILWTNQLNQSVKDGQPVLVADSLRGTDGNACTITASTVIPSTAFGKKNPKNLMPKWKVDRYFQKSYSWKIAQIFRTAACFRRARLSTKKGKIVNLQAVIARVHGNHARTHTHFKFVTEFADVSPFRLFHASSHDVLRFTYCRPAADLTAACEQALVWPGHDIAESGRD